MSASLFDLSGRVAVITGASSGLGARFARVLRGAGADVVLAARRVDRLDALAAELGADHALGVRVDVRQEAAVIELVTTAVERFGRLDVMVNNVGLADPGAAEEEPTETFRDVVEVNLTCRGARGA